MEVKIERNCGKILREVFYWIGRDWSSAAGNVCRPLRKRGVSASEHDDGSPGLDDLLLEDKHGISCDDDSSSPS